MLAQDLHADRPLACNDIRIVIRMDEGETSLRLKPTGLGVGLVKALAVEDHTATLPSHSLNFDRGGGARHHDGGLSTQPLSRESHALSMIARRSTDHPTLESLPWQARHLGVGAAQLEREYRLKVLALEPNRASQALRQARHGIERALDRHIINPGS